MSTPPLPPPTPPPYPLPPPGPSNPFDREHHPSTVDGLDQDSQRPAASACGGAGGPGTAPTHEIVAGPFQQSSDVRWCDLGGHRLPAGASWWLITLITDPRWEADRGAACAACAACADRAEPQRRRSAPMGYADAIERSAYARQATVDGDAR